MLFFARSHGKRVEGAGGAAGAFSADSTMRMQCLPSNRVLVSQQHLCRATAFDLVLEGKAVNPPSSAARGKSLPQYIPGSGFVPVEMDGGSAAGESVRDKYLVLPGDADSKALLVIFLLSFFSPPHKLLDHRVSLIRSFQFTVVGSPDSQSSRSAGAADLNVCPQGKYKASWEPIFLQSPEVHCVDCFPSAEGLGK